MTSRLAAIALTVGFVGAPFATRAGEAEKALPSSALRFVAIAPCRLVDTRGNGFTGAFGPPSLVAASTRDFPVAGHCGIAGTAQAASLNVTVVNPDRPGFIGIWPGGDPAPNPLVSSVNYLAGQIVPNAVVAPLGASGAMTVVTVGKTDLIVDVNGYYDAAVPVENLNGLAGSVTLAPGSNITITPTGNTLTIGASSGAGGLLPAGTVGQTLRSNGSGWLASSALTNDGTHIGVTGNLTLPNTAASGAAGVVSLGTARFLHNYGFSGAGNTFVGQDAGSFVLTGGSNTAVGYRSLVGNTSGYGNTAMGYRSLTTNIDGHSNAGFGRDSLFSNSTGFLNTAVGTASMYSNTGGHHNVATGADSLAANTLGYFNTAAGSLSLHGNTGGHSNTSMGANALAFNTTGNENAAFGKSAGSAVVTGTRNTFLGAFSDASATAPTDITNATAIGYGAIVEASNRVRIGNTLVTEIGGQVAWSNLSDSRHKRDIRDLDVGLDFVLALRPVSYTLVGGDSRTDMGFLAQDVEALLGEGYGVLGIGSDAERTLSLRYGDLLAPLVKAIQEQHQQVEAQKTELAERDKRIAELEQRLIRLEQAMR